MTACTGSPTMTALAASGSPATSGRRRLGQLPAVRGSDRFRVVVVRHISMVGTPGGAGKDTHTLPDGPAPIAHVAHARGIRAAQAQAPASDVTAG